MIENKKEGLFVLSTAHTTYAFRVTDTGQLEHLYYGKKIRIYDASALTEKHAFAIGNSIAYKNDRADFTLEDLCLETSGYGKGDIREPMVEVICPDGSRTVDFVFEKNSIEKGKPEFKTLPGSYDETGNVDHLTITMRDQNHGYGLELHYYVYEDCDVITRSARFVNETDKTVALTRMLSMQLDINRAGLSFMTFHGGWTKEMQKKNCTLTGGKFVNSSFTGTSSNRSNPFFIVSDPETTETAGNCIGINLIYSGNHYSAAEVSSQDKTRIVTGINPTEFTFTLLPGDDFEAPEAVLCYSDQGLTGMSHRMHDFVRRHIVRGVWRDKERPVLLNSWEASYFNIDEGSLVSLAKKAKEVGIELFVMDDGWFGQRNDDKHALGDWTPNPKKLPHGLKGLCDKINALGLMFGIWIEPEMVNTDSDLYREHPNWSMEIPGMNHSEGRNQRLLDLANPQVVDEMIGRIKNVLSSANIAYVKWDMNRIMSDVYSLYLPPERQQETAHRYVLGLYRMMKELTEAFPEILFEGCASGGNRFDLGALCYFPQIWASDNTDAISRLRIQNGYSYGYPMNTVTAHVSSCPNHQTLRVTPLSSRYGVASFGVLGYECNLSDLPKEELNQIALQVETYKKNRHTLQFGDFYRNREGNVYEWTTVEKDGSRAVGMILQQQVMPGEMYQSFHARGLSEDQLYHFYSMPLKHNVKVFGDLINMAAPFHIRQGSFIHSLVAKLVKMDEKGEDLYAYGDALMYGGVNLAQSYIGTGFDERVRVMADYDCRIYYIEEAEEPPATEEVPVIEEKKAEMNS